jgi:hypothetical protein
MMLAKYLCQSGKIYRSRSLDPYARVGVPYANSSV